MERQRPVVAVPIIKACAECIHYIQSELPSVGLCQWHLALVLKYDKSCSQHKDKE